MSVGSVARDLNTPAVHTQIGKVDYTNGSATVEIGDLPPCLVTAVKAVKSADWNSGTSATVSIGVLYADGSASDPTLLASTADLTSGSALGPVSIARDLGGFELTQATTLTVTLALSGATSAGAAHLVVEYVPSKQVKDLI